jgi:hypothetical protein
MALLLLPFWPVTTREKGTRVKRIDVTAYFPEKLNKLSPAERERGIAPMRELDEKAR